MTRSRRVTRSSGLAGIEQLIGVYDAEAGLVGELRYAVGKLGGRHCSLCDLTHRWLRQRGDWTAMVERLGVPFELRHRNEQDAALRRLTAGAVPSVLARRGGQLTVLLRPGDLATCRADPRELERRLRAAARDMPPDQV